MIQNLEVSNEVSVAGLRFGAAQVLGLLPEDIGFQFTNVSISDQIVSFG